jgi:virulence factor Mce-like protein
MRLLLRVVLLAALAALVYYAVAAITKTPSGLEVRALFTDAHGLVDGNDVRIDGAPAGRVDSITLSDGGAALVTMRLNDGLSRPRADATAAIRPVDLLGDTYVALEPGHAGAALRGAIPSSRTLNDPRLDDLLRVFRAPQRAGMKAMLVSLGIALDNRGSDLNRAALDLRPTLAAASGVMLELGSQNADLKAFVADAEPVVAQGAARRRQLGSLLHTLAALLGTTAAHSAGLDAGLQTMPQTLAQARTTAGTLTATAVAARPLAQELAGAAGNLSAAARRLPGFLGSLTAASGALRPTLRSATGVLRQGDPTLSTLAAGLRSIITAAPDTAALTSALVPAAPEIAQGFFVNFPDQASEPGKQPLDPFADPLRDYWRGAAVISCQTFGVPIAPGCLTKFLSGLGASARRRSAAASGLLDYLIKP